MKRTKLFFGVGLSLSLVGSGLAYEPTPSAGTLSFVQAQPKRRARIDGDKLVAIYGANLAVADTQQGETPLQLANRFVNENNSDAFGVGVCNTVGVCDLTLSRSILIKNGTMEVFTYTQTIEDLPVYGCSLKIPVHLDVGGITGNHRVGYIGIELMQKPDPALPADSVSEATAKLTVENDPAYAAIDPATFTVATKVIYENKKGIAHRAWHFDGSGGEEAYRFFVDTNTGNIVAAENLVSDFEVTGNVTVQGNVTECCPSGSPGFPDCCSSDPTENPPVQRPIAGVDVYLIDEQSPCLGGSGTILDQGPTDSSGVFSYSVDNGFDGGQATSELIGDWVTVINCTDAAESTACPGVNDIANEAIICGAVPQTGGDLGILYSPSSVAIETQQATVFRTITGVHDWLKELQPFLTEIDLPVTGIIWSLGPRYFHATKTVALSRETAARNATGPDVIAHEYGHFLFKHLFPEATLNPVLDEGFADTIAVLYLDTPFLGWHWVKSPTHDFFRRADMPDFRFDFKMNFKCPDPYLPTNCTTEALLEYALSWDGCGDENDEHCFGLAFGGAFWDLRLAIGLAETQRIFADFLTISDGGWDSSIMAEVLSADDTDGDLCNDSPHKDAIIAAFDKHGWVWDNDPSLCQALGAVSVSWSSPEEIDPNSDYTVDATQDPPAVILRAKKDANGVEIATWSIGRTIGGIPRDIGSVSADWGVDPDPDPDFDITVRLGHKDDAALFVRKVGQTIIERQDPAATWSSVEFELANGRVLGQTHVWADPSGAGGRVGGSVPGTIAQVTAQAIGLDAEDDKLSVGAITAVMKLESHPATSTLVVAGGGTSTGDFILNGSIDGTLRIDTPFTGKLCATNAKTDLANIDLANINVVFDTGAMVCDIENGECQAESLCIEPQCSGSSITAPTAEPLPGGQKDRFISFGVPELANQQPYAIKVTLDSLYNPRPAVQNPMDFSALEGQVRYVKVAAKMCTGGNEPGYAVCTSQADCVARELGGTCGDGVNCLDSPAFNTTYKCAVLGCQPEYRNWASEGLAGSDILHVTGNAIIPESVYDVRFIQEVSATTIECRSAGLTIETGVYGDTDANGLVNVTDIINTVDVVKQVASAIPERQVYIRSPEPKPASDSTNVADIVLHVEAVKLSTYKIAITTCP